MATVSASSAWAKPGAWALDSEENEAMEILQRQQQQIETERANSYLIENSNLQNQPLADFPSLSTAAATKSKKKKPQTLSLSELHTGKSVTYSAAKAAHQTTATIQAKGLTADELLILPTGPRERSAEELDRSRSGGGFRSYGSDNGRSRYSSGDDSSNPRWGSSRTSEEPRRNGGGGFSREFNRESAPPPPSRADEIDDWGAAKKSVAPPSFERRERGGFFDSQSRADESDSWVSNKRGVVPSEGRKMGGGFENHRERRGGFEASNGGGADSDSWGKKRETEGSGSGSGSARPRLVLQPRTVPVSNEEQQQLQSGLGSMTRGKGSNPFGEARPREAVLAEKGQDWKKIDEQLDSMKNKEMGLGGDALSFGKKSFGTGNGRAASLPEERTEGSWRKRDADDAPPPSIEKIDEGVAEN